MSSAPILPCTAVVLLLSTLAGCSEPESAPPPASNTFSTLPASERPTEKDFRMMLDDQQAQQAQQAQQPAQTAAAPVGPTPPPPVGGTVVALDTAASALMARPETGATAVTLQHVLIGFQGSVESASRSKDEALQLAARVFGEARAGADFDSLVRMHTNDSAPGIYPVTQQSRRDMVRAFGDVGFRLQPGEVGIAPWSADASPFGWHIIKRLK